MNIDDTITAISTPPGKGGIGIIRISGRMSYKIGKLITGSDMDPRKAHLSKFYNLDKEMIDSGIVIFFKSPIGKALIGKNEWEMVSVTTPSGVRNFEIQKVEYI